MSSHTICLFHIASPNILGCNNILSWHLLLIQRSWFIIPFV